MTQVNHSPGVPNSASLATVVASSATPILVGPTALTGQLTITTLAQFTTETTNTWPQVLVAQALRYSAEPLQCRSIVMIHSRPGYAPRTDENHVAKLNDDMIPAINRKPPLEAAGQVDLATKLAGRKLKTKPAVVPEGTIEPPEDIAAAAARATGPELILNPEPSATPQVLEPGK